MTGYRAFCLGYGLVGYLLGIISVIYLAGFIADFGVPKGIGDGHSGLWAIDVCINTLLVWTFGLHHSVTARTSFKRWWTRFIPASIERATYLYMTALMIGLLVVLWRPIPMVIWDLEASWAITVTFLGYGCAWAMMVAATFHFGHFEFFGLAQAWRAFRSRPTPNSDISVRFLYALVRHPISLGWMITPWLTPTLTVGHVVFALAMMLYIIAATRFEESDLIQELGQDYVDYREQTSAFIPFTKTLRTKS